MVEPVSHICSWHGCIVLCVPSVMNTSGKMPCGRESNPLADPDKGQQLHTQSAAQSENGKIGSKGMGVGIYGGASKSA